MRTGVFSSADSHPEKGQERKNNRNDTSEAEGEVSGAQTPSSGLSGRPGVEER